MVSFRNAAYETDVDRATDEPATMTLVASLPGARGPGLDGAEPVDIRSLHIDTPVIFDSSPTRITASSLYIVSNLCDA